MFRRYDSETDRQLQTDLQEQSMQLVKSRLQADAEFKKRYFNREVVTTLGVAVAFSGVLSRDKIRTVACMSNLLWHARLQRMLGLGHWEYFNIVGEGVLHAIIRGETRGLLCPFHIGNYRQLIPFLVMQGMRIVVLADDRNSALMKDQLWGTGIRNYESRWRKQFGQPPLDVDKIERSVRIVSSGNIASLWQLRSCIESGFVPVVFADGNEGAVENSTVVRTRFYNREISVHVGIAILSSYLDLEVIPVLFRDWESNGPEIEFRTPIRKYADESRDRFASRCMSTLFKELACSIELSLEEWEEWPKVSGWAIETEQVPTSRFGYNQVNGNLNIADNNFWVLDFAETAYVVDVRRQHRWIEDQFAVSLLSAAEKGKCVSEWLKSQSDSASAKRILEGMLAMGAVEIR